MALPRASTTARRRPAAALAVTGLSALLLVGCQSNPAPPPLQRTAPSASPSPSVPVAPTMPPEARGTSKAAAKAFVRHYISTVNYAMATGETAQLAALSGPNCGTCTAIADKVEQIYGNGGHLEGAGWSVLTLSYIDSGAPRSPLLSAGIKIAPQVAYHHNGGTPKWSKRSRGNLDFWLLFSRSSWYVSKLEATQ